MTFRIDLRQLLKIEKVDRILHYYPPPITPPIPPLLWPGNTGGERLQIFGLKGPKISAKGVVLKSF